MRLCRRRAEEERRAQGCSLSCWSPLRAPMPGGQGLGAARGRHRPNPCPCPQGSMYDSLADNYNNYGTSSRSSFYSKFQAGSGSWGYPVRSCFLGTCRHGPWFEQEKASWLLRRRWGAAGSPRGNPPFLTGLFAWPLFHVALLQPPSGQSGYF